MTAAPIPIKGIKGHYVASRSKSQAVSAGLVLFFQAGGLPRPQHSEYRSRCNEVISAPLGFDQGLFASEQFSEPFVDIAPWPDEHNHRGGILDLVDDSVVRDRQRPEPLQFAFQRFAGKRILRKIVQCFTNRTFHVRMQMANDLVGSSRKGD